MKCPTAILALILVSGCLQEQVQQPMQHQSAGRQGADDTLALTCSELSTRNARITERVAQLQNEATATARTNAIANTALTVGFGALLGQSVASGADAIRATSALGSGMSSVLSAEAGRGQMTNVTDTRTLAHRSAALQRAMIEKGC